MISYLQAENLTKSYGEEVLFEDISFGISKDQKIALIAKNGTGKTSLLNILTGKDTPDSGSVSMRNDVSIGYLEQNPPVDDNKTVKEQVFETANEIINAIREYEDSLVSGDENRMQEAIEKMDFHKAWDYELQIKQILTELKIDDLNQIVGQLSGGQKKRVAMANLLINEPDLLILDEPTNHLDLEMIEWLERYMQKTKSTLLMVTHDRYFLDRICNEIIEIDNNTVFQYKGNYSYYLEKREERIKLHNQNVEKAQNLLRTEIDWMRRMPQARGTKAKYRIDNYYKLEETAKGGLEEEKLELDIKTRRLGKKILEIYNLSKSFGDLKIVEDFSYKFSRNEKIGIIGNNGSGKTTFLNLITENLAADAGKIEKGETVVYGYYKQSGIKIDGNKKVIEVIKEISENITLGNGRQISALQFLEYFNFEAEMHYAYVHKLSGGERRRLYLMTVLMKNPNFLILDEPTNDLDIMTLNVLEDYLLNFKGCLIIVSHDRYFMDKVVGNVFVFEGNAKIINYPGNYTQYYNLKKDLEKKEKKQEKEVKPEKKKPQKEKVRKLTFKEKKEMEALEKEMPKLEAEKTQLETELSSGTLPTGEIVEKSKRLSELSELLDEKEMRWLELSEI